jgi:hypothetical protein
VARFFLARLLSTSMLVSLNHFEKQDQKSLTNWAMNVIAVTPRRLQRRWLLLDGG